MIQKPTLKPAQSCFSSGPCAKRPGWSLDALKGAFLGRSHRASGGKAKLKETIDAHRALLKIPADYKIGIVPASDTGAIEMAMWSMLGARGVDVLSWETFSKEWMKDVKTQLKCSDARFFDCDFGTLPDLAAVDTDRDVVFVWNGTTSGVRVPNADWIRSDRAGLTLCDATSAVFAHDMPWDKLDVTTWSWQKVLGGEAAHGMIVLSPRAIERLTSYTPPWPLPKIFRMTKKGELIDGVFVGETINTPSMLAVEDCLDALAWVRSIGGLEATITRCASNACVLYDWAARTHWVRPLPQDPATYSHTSVCFAFADPAVASLPREAQMEFSKDMTKLLEKESVAFDINHYRDAPAGIRIWCGATIESADLAALTPWLDWAYTETLSARTQKAA